eukprot:scaffold7053_cov380-Pinguiococcus_pyrenoidosus.AAC.3
MTSIFHRGLRSAVTYYPEEHEHFALCTKPERSERIRGTNALRLRRQLVSDGLPTGLLALPDHEAMRAQEGLSCTG